MPQSRGRRQQGQRKGGERDDADPGGHRQGVDHKHTAEDRAHVACGRCFPASESQCQQADGERNRLALRGVMASPGEVESQHEQRTEHKMRLGLQGVEQTGVVRVHKAPPVNSA